MNRREFSGAIALGALTTAASQALAAPAAAQTAAPFGRQTVVALAEQLAGKPFEPAPPVPESIQKLSYDQHRDIRFRSEASLWRGEGRGFTIDLLHTGFVLKNAVDIYAVEDGAPRRISYSPQMFDFGPLVPNVPPAGTNLLSGIRVRAPINTPDYFDEFAVFQGASFFRGVGQGMIYGLSARGLAIDTAEPRGEEFPFFRTFWVERPDFAAKTLTLHALLDSKSVTGAYQFRIIPGHTSRMDVEATLFARRELRVLGVAPLTSMFLFDATNRSRFEDFRPAVYDSDGLAIRRGNGEWIWRPLANPKTLQISAFMDKNPAGYGLLQRGSRFETFQDLEARYELRPSAWVEPKSGWGDGHIVLVEIPTERETNDNIVSFWRPREPLKPGQSQSLGYWVHWGPGVGERRLAQVGSTRAGQTTDGQRRLFVVDFRAPSFGPVDFAEVQPQVSASRGSIRNVVGRRNPVTGGYRVSFELETGNAELSEMRLVLSRGSEPISETWLYRWTR